MMPNTTSSAFAPWATGNQAAVAHGPHTTCSVKVVNLPQDTTESWIRMLFSPTGRVVAVSRQDEDGYSTATVRFATPQQADAAFRFNGYVANGKCLHILPVSNIEEASMIPAHAGAMSSPRGGDMTPPVLRPRPATASGRARVTDTGPTHKNLYILNLPLDVTTDQLAGLFARYGTVIHCVILAMLDAQARRRGFIDMSQPSEAKDAIEGLNGFVWHGYPIEVSYAIVQRSGGPFDPAAAGRNVIKRNVPRNRFNTGPRRVPSDGSPPHTPGGPIGFDYAGMASGFSPSPCPSSPGFSDGSGSSAEFQGIDPRTVFITGMNPDIVVTDDGLRRVVEHLGEVVRASLARDDFGIARGSGTVVFASEDDAHRAVFGLNGKLVDGRRISALKLHGYGASPEILGHPLAGWTPGYARSGGAHGLGDSHPVSFPSVSQPLERPGLRNVDGTAAASWQRPIASNTGGSTLQFDPAARPAERLPGASLASLSYFTPEAKLRGSGRVIGPDGSEPDATGRSIGWAKGDPDWQGSFHPFGPDHGISASATAPSLLGMTQTPPTTQGDGQFAVGGQVPASALNPRNAMPTASAGFGRSQQSTAYDWSRFGPESVKNLRDDAASAMIWTPPRKDPVQPEDSPGCARSVSSVDSSTSVLKTPDSFDRLSLHLNNASWHMGPFGFGTDGPAFQYGARQSRGDELREGSLPFKSGPQPDPVASPVGKAAKRKSLPPVGHEKLSSSPKSPEDKSGNKDAEDFRLDLRSLTLTD